MIKLNDIDEGRPFDWGKASKDYAKYRDIYPEEFYKCILDLGLCKDGQRVLDIGTGTGVLPRNMYGFGAKWTGTDISENQIEQAKKLAAEQGMDIDFYACPAEEVDYPDGTFDVITVCQCIWYLNAKVFPKNFSKMLKPGGKLLILYMGWLPYEDEIAGKSEEIILKYNPAWTGCGDKVQPVFVPEELNLYFDIVKREEFRVDVPFTREGWHGRMRACRGVGASMDENNLKLWDKEHMEMLQNNAPEKFDVKHYISYAELQVKKQ
ncbi:class I SAM-dependent methyltransferase [Pseudobutyrivibrio sp.]|uniref:class I SAM-dependent methyltransferase n=1 Tax=Pseudobutyrivibrio sp. TaxID=2014367 RepID=UPI0025EC5E87|nr:class I SAM-dependent methyltransferase [Pseudobutyrivibrio sp.]MBR5649421.1 methyltransferase domain-containing protein [Pseudobutyrivibrio sp.]